MQISLRLFLLIFLRASSSVPCSRANERPCRPSQLAAGNGKSLARIRSQLVENWAE